jgi:hypothetical protein
MADNRTLQSTVATIAAGAVAALYEVTFSGDTALIAPTVLGTISGSEGARTFTEVSASNPLPISDAAGSITVDGTVAVSGTVAITDNAGSLTVDAPVGTPVFVRLSDGSSPITTLPVSLASAPSTAVTNAGTFVVQENGAALTALQLIDNLPNTQGSTTSGQSGVLVQGAVTTGAPSYTTAQTSPLSLDTTGSLRVAITSGAGSGGTAVADRTGTFTPGSTSFTPIGGYVDDSASDALAEGNPGAVRMTTARAMHQNIAQVAGATVATGNGTAAGAIRVALPTDGTGAISTVTTVTTLTGTTTLTPGTGATNLGKAVDSVVGATDTGVASLYRRIDTPATITPAVADYAEGRVDAQGRQWVQPSGGMTTGTVTTVAASISSVSILASNTARKGYIIWNDTTTDGIILYLKLGATASATSFSHRLLPGENISIFGPCYTGAIDGIWSSATGNARITELS